MLKALLVLEIWGSWLFGYVEKSGQLTEIFFFWKNSHTRRGDKASPRHFYKISK